MGNFLSKLKEISSKLNPSASTSWRIPADNFQEIAPEKPQQSVEAELLDQEQLTEVKRPYSKNISQLWQRLNTPKPLYRRYWLLLGMGIGSGAIAIGAIWWNLERSIPDSVAQVLTFMRDGTLTIKAEDGTILQQTGPATREELKISEFPQPLIQAFIASEDHRFYEHQGVDYRGVLRALFSNLQARDVVEGGSTITQQLARIVFLDQNRNVWRKLKEVMIAQKIEQEIEKEKILERYLNLVYLGSGAYGVADASWVYFSKPLKELTLPEMATLVGLTPAPSLYSPFLNPEAAKVRRNQVLQKMQEAGFITAQQAQKAIATPLTPKQSLPKRFNREAPYFTEYIQKELPKYVPAKVLAKGGLIIETTLNPQWQKSAEVAITKTIENNGRWQNFEQAALVAIDPRNGDVKAMVGGKDFYKNQFNRVTQAQRQPGSTFKMFVYSTAIAAGFTPYRGYLDAPYAVDGYRPENSSKSFNGWLSMKDALASSINVIAVKILVDVGWQPIIDLAQKMGIESPLQPTYSLALGSSEVNLLELTSAYGTLATKGMHTKAHGIKRILDSNGKVIYQADFQAERALDQETSAIMTWMLRGVVNNGTGSSADLADRPVAGKTGTSDDSRDLWFIGYIPQVVAGVWLGNDNNKPTWGSSSTAAYTWHQFMAKVVDGMPVEKFPQIPDKLEGRKPQIKIQPIKAKIISSARYSNEDDSRKYRQKRSRYNTDTSDSDQQQPRRRRRYRPPVQSEASNSSQESISRRSRQRTQNEEQPTPRYRRRSRQQEASVPRAREVSPNNTSSVRETAPSITPPAPPASRREEAEPTIIPPAPPAERKQETTTP